MRLAPAPSTFGELRRRARHGADGAAGELPRRY
jgi:hypothetical protein